MACNDASAALTAAQEHLAAASWHLAQHPNPSIKRGKAVFALDDLQSMLAVIEAVIAAPSRLLSS